MKINGNVSTLSISMKLIYHFYSLSIKHKERTKFEVPSIQEPEIEFSYHPCFMLINSFLDLSPFVGFVFCFWFLFVSIIFNMVGTVIA